MKRFFYFFTILTLLGVIVIVMGIGSLGAFRSQKPHWFDLSEQPRYLTDELALSMAKEVLALEGYDLTLWIPREDGRTKSPDGQVDKYLARNGLHPNQGTIQFINKSQSDARLVTVELNGQRLCCKVRKGF